MSDKTLLQSVLAVMAAGFVSVFVLFQSNHNWASWFLLLILLIVSASYIFACRKAQHLEISKSVLLLTAALLHLVVIPVPLFYSETVFRLLWDGFLQAQGVNPFLFTPAADEIATMRQTELFFYMQDQLGVFSAFSPVMQVFSRFSAYLIPVLGLQGMILLYKMVTSVLLLVCVSWLFDYLSLNQQNTNLAVWLAWNPVLILLGAGQGELVLFVLLPLLFVLKSKVISNVEMVLWGIFMHVSLLGWLLLPALLKISSWRMLVIAIITWMAWWLPFFSMEAFGNYLAVLWFNLHTPAASLSPFYLLSNIHTAANFIYAIAFVATLVICSFWLYRKTESEFPISYFLIVAAITIIFHPVWSITGAALVLLLLVLTNQQRSAYYALTLLPLLFIPVLIWGNNLLIPVNLGAGLVLGITLLTSYKKQ